MSPMFEQMFGNLAALLQRQKSVRTGSGARQSLNRQISAAKNQIKSTPEHKAFVAQCSRELKILNAENHAQNKGDMYWNMNPNIITGNCQFHIVDNTSQGGGGGD